jgi:hypothetical protein
MNAERVRGAYGVLWEPLVVQAQKVVGVAFDDRLERCACACEGEERVFVSRAAYPVYEILKDEVVNFERERFECRWHCGNLWGGGRRGCL